MFFPESNGVTRVPERNTICNYSTHMIPRDERPAAITRTMRILLLSALVTSSLGFAALPAAPSAALAGRMSPARGGPLLAYDVAARISPPPAGKGCHRPAREPGSGAWTHKYPVVLGSHVSVSVQLPRECVSERSAACFCGCVALFVSRPCTCKPKRASLSGCS